MNFYDFERHKPIQSDLIVSNGYVIKSMKQR